MIRQKAITGCVEVIGSETLRRELNQLLATTNKCRATFVVTVKGKPSAVLMGIQDYMGRIRGLKRDELLAAIQADARAAGSDRLTAQQIEREIAAVRRQKRHDHARRGS